jgi:aqualysin 1
MRTSRFLFGAAAWAALAGQSLFAGCAAPDDAEPAGRAAAPLVGDDPGAAPGEYIVVFHEGASANETAALVGRVRLSKDSAMLFEYSIVPGFAARLSAADLAEVRADRNVRYVERNGAVRASKIEPAGADGIDRIDQRNLPRDGLYDDRGRDGEGVNVYIIDTGIRPTHNEFAGRVGVRQDFVGDGQTDDCNGHGTHVASTAAGAQFGVADRATIHAVRVLNCAGSGSFAGVIAGVNFVAQHCAGDCVANMSLGGGFSQAIHDTVANAVAAGVPFVVAAGNESTNACTRSPASAPAAITVGAVDDNDARANFSNVGTCVDLFAPGVTILGAAHTSNTATQSISGTSMASPHVAGVVAQILDCNPGATPAQVEAILKGAATPGVVGNPGGAPNLLLFNDVCATSNSCAQSNSCGGQAPAGCFCDQFCTAFGDCCPDGPC